MRFAYIDSQGNEVSIPSVDALALRIELGAISDDTKLYDAQADRWGPAHTHEIFHTLSRDAEEDFVAPPPAMAPTPPASGGPEPEAEPEPVPEAEAQPGPEVGSELAGELGSPDLGGGFSLAGDPTDEGQDTGGGLSGIGLDLSPIPDAEALVDGGGGDEEEEGGFDFGDFSGGLELEPALGSDTDPVPAVEAEAPMDFSDGGMDLESPMDFSGDGGAIGLDTGLDTGLEGGGMELEKPMSEYTPDAPPQWMDESDPYGGDQDEAPIEFGAPSSPVVGGTSDAPPGRREDQPLERPKPRTRPSPPRRPKQRLPIGMIVVVVLVLAGGAGGFVAWQSFSAAEVVEVPALPPVVIPDIPAELLPQMRDLAEAAVAAMLEDLRGRAAALDIPTEPRDEWLGGNYLSNASQFEDIEQFWLGIERFVDEVRATDTQLFHDKYVVEVESAGIAADEAALLIERADSGFVAARDGRFEAYNLMDDLINAALDLHLFLLDNEEQIAYEPAVAGVSRDPVLEAVPNTTVLGDAMWGLVNGITDSLAELGTLDRVTRERLFAVLFDRIRRAGVQ